MHRTRHQRSRQSHYLLLVNQSAGNYSRDKVSDLISAIRSKQGFYTVLSPDSASRMTSMARTNVGLQPARRPLPQAVTRRGKVSAIVACGGDGTFNLAARIAMDAELPVGLLPLGRFNNIAKSLFGTDKPDPGAVVEGNYRTIDVGTIDNLTFFGSLGLGFIPQLAEELQDTKLPRFGFGWSRLAGRTAAKVKLRKSVIKIDSFIFELSPLMINVNLLSYSSGLPLSTSSLADDGHAEVIFDQGSQMGEFATFARQIASGKYYYGSDFHLYRGQIIRIQSRAGRQLYLDGELIKSPTAELAVEILEKKLKVFC
ncbi:MAG: diacylglycerol kinase family protein [candidate division Zixibacteria bacterium]